MQELEQQLEDADGEISRVSDRTKVMEEHLKSVRTELGYTQGRLGHAKSELQSERHMRALMDREAARRQADIKTLRKERADLQERVAGLQGRIYRATEQIDQFKVRERGHLLRHRRSCSVLAIVE